MAVSNTYSKFFNQFKEKGNKNLLICHKFHTLKDLKTYVKLVKNGAQVKLTGDKDSDGKTNLYAIYYNKVRKSPSLTLAEFNRQIVLNALCRGSSREFHKLIEDRLIRTHENDESCGLPSHIVGASSGGKRVYRHTYLKAETGEIDPFEIDWFTISLDELIVTREALQDLNIESY